MDQWNWSLSLKKKKEYRKTRNVSSVWSWQMNNSIRAKVHLDSDAVDISLQMLFMTCMYLEVSNLFSETRERREWEKVFLTPSF